MIDPNPVRERESQLARQERSEQRIIRAVVEIIARPGVHGLALGEVRKKAGYSRALPSHLSGSRSNLFCECVRRVIVDHWIGGLPEADAEHGFEALADAIRRWMGELAERPMHSRAYLLLQQHTMSTDTEIEEPELTRLVHSVVAGGEGRYHPYIEAGQRSGRIKPELDADYEALMIHSTLRGLSMRWLLAPESVDFFSRRCTDCRASIPQIRCLYDL